jgi:hypothetical protein
MRQSRPARWLRDARAFPADARAAWRREGMGGVWRELRGRTLSRVFATYDFLVIEKDLSDGLETPAPSGVSIERFTGDWEALSALVGAPRRARFEEAAAQGRVCFLARRGERPIGYAWLAERMDFRFDPPRPTSPTSTSCPESGTRVWVRPSSPRDCATPARARWSGPGRSWLPATTPRCA